MRKIVIKRQEIVIIDENHTVTGHFSGPNNKYLPPRIYGKTVRDNVVRTCVDVVVKDKKNRVLLGKRKIKPWNNWWTFGGSMIPGESPAKACSRVIKNDLGLYIPPEQSSLIGFKSSVFGERQEEPKRNGCHDFNLFHVVTLDGEEELNPDKKEYLKVKWFLPAEIIVPTFHPTIVEMISKAIA